MLLACLGDDCLGVPRHSHQGTLRIGLVFETVINAAMVDVGSHLGQ